MEKKTPLGFRLRTLNNEINRYLDRRAREQGLDDATLSNMWVLRVLYENRRHDVFQKDLEVECGLARSTVTGIVKLMESKGLLRRESVPEDLRLKKLTLTEEGIAAHKTMVHISAELERTLTKGVTVDERAAFAAMLRRMQRNLRIGS